MKQLFLFVSIFFAFPLCSYGQQAKPLKSISLPIPASPKSTIPTVVVPTGSMVFVNNKVTVSTVKPNGTKNNPYPKIQDAVNKIKFIGGTIHVLPGLYEEHLKIDGIVKPILLTTSTTNPAMIDGSTKISGWTRISNTNIYYAKSPFDVSQVFYKGQFLPRAQYPQKGFLKVGTNAPVYLTSNNNTTIPVSNSDISFLSKQDLSGATVTIRAIDYWYNSAVITNLDVANKILNLNQTPLQPFECYPNCYLSYNAKADWGYYLENKFWMMKSPGTWVYDPIKKLIYVWLPNNQNPAYDDVRLASDSDVISIQNSPNLTISNIKIQNSGKNGIFVKSSPRLRLNNLILNNITRIGIYAFYSEPFNMDYTTIKNTGSDGIRFSYSKSVPAISPCNIEANILENIGLATGPKFTSAAINFSGGGRNPNATKIRYNKIINTAYVGIMSGTGHIIESNTIINSCLLADDCGAIYTSDRNPAKLIKGNFIKGATAFLQGKARGAYPVSGIYLDDHSNGVTVLDNIVIDTDLGFMLHNSHDNTLMNNIVYNFTKAAARIQEDTVRRGFSEKDNAFIPILNTRGKTFPAMNKNIFIGNTFITTTPSSPSYTFMTNQTTGKENIARTFTGSQNTYINFQNETQLLYSPSAFRFEDLIALGVDVAPRRLFTTAQQSFETLSFGKTLLSGASSEFSKYSQWSKTGAPTKKLIPCPIKSDSGACLSFNASLTAESRLVSPAFAVKENQYYRIHVQLKSGSYSNLPISAQFVHAGPPYENINATGQSVTFFPTTASDSNWLNYDFYFKSKSTLPAGRIDLVIPAKYNIILGTLTVKEVTVGLKDFANSSQLLINEQTVEAALSCPVKANFCQGWKDLNKTDAIFPLKLPTRSLLYLWRN